MPYTLSDEMEIIDLGQEVAYWLSKHMKITDLR